MNCEICETLLSSEKFDRKRKGRVLCSECAVIQKIGSYGEEASKIRFIEKHSWKILLAVAGSAKSGTRAMSDSNYEILCMVLRNKLDERKKKREELKASERKEVNEALKALGLAELDD